MDLDEGSSEANTQHSSVYSDEAGFYNYGNFSPDDSILFPGRILSKSVGLNLASKCNSSHFRLWACFHFSS